MTTDPKPALLPVEQSDRDAAVKLIRLIDHRTEYLSEIEDGSYDENYFVQAFACNRLTTPAPTSKGPGEVEERARDVLIGDFIAQWDDAADGVMMDADTAEALARELKRMRDLIYIPGVFQCKKCSFRLIQSSLNANDGAVTSRDEPGEKCPNDGSPMWRVTYRDDQAYSYDRWEEQVTRAVAAEKALAALSPAAPAENGLREDDGLEVAAQYHDQKAAKWRKEARRHYRSSGNSPCMDRDNRRALDHERFAEDLRTMARLRAATPSQTAENAASTKLPVESEQANDVSQNAGGERGLG